jgi:hypothetical protein
VPHLLVHVIDVVTEVRSKPRVRIPQDEPNSYSGFDGNAGDQLCRRPRRRRERRKGALDVLGAASEELTGHSDNGIGRENIRTQRREVRIEGILTSQGVVNAVALRVRKRAQEY